MHIVSAAMVPHPPLIIPQVGRGQEKAIGHTIESYQKAAELLASHKPETIVVLTPHSVMYGDYFHISPGKNAKGSFAQFQAGEVAFSVAYDTEFVAELCRRADGEGLHAGTRGERDAKLDHGTMVPLYFLREACGGEIRSRIVRIGLSGLPYHDHYRLGMLIRETAEHLGRKTAIVASGDLSHRLKPDGPYGFKEEGPVYDRRVMDVMGRAAFGELFEFVPDFCESAGECGHRSMLILAGCFDGLRVEGDRLSYEGPFGVGYGVCTYLPEGEDPERHFLAEYANRQKAMLDTKKRKEDAYVRLARKSLEAYVLRGETIDVPDGLPGEMTAHKAGAFVSLKKDGQLRGCIGTISATTQSIAHEIIQNAISACAHDPRFEPVAPEELDGLLYSVDILAEAEDIDSPQMLDVKRYGVIVTSGHKRGLLLPNLDGIDTVEEQIAIAKRKAGIRDNEKVSLKRFEVIRHH